MKTTRIVFQSVVIAAAFTFAACEDSKMEWGIPEGHQPVTSDELPLSVKEVIANYDDIKTIAAQYTPNLIVGLGAGAAQYVEGGTYKALADSNFQMITLGNAMKMDAIVTNSGGFNFETLDAFLATKPEDMKLYGHNFLWHTQQKQAYLLSLIKPKQVIETEGDIANLLTGDDSDFEGGTKGSWGSWGNSSSSSVAEPGAASKWCMLLSNPTDANAWSAQCAYTFADYLAPDTYKLRFKAKTTTPGGQVQFQYQNGSTYGSQGGYTTFDLTTEWATYEADIAVTPEDVNRILFNFGAVAGDYYIDDVMFGLAQSQENTIANTLVGDSYDFDGGTKGGWGSWGNSSSTDVAQPGYKNSAYCMLLENPTDANAWSAQCAYTYSDYLSVGAYKLRFKAKSENAGGSIQFQYQNSSTYGSQGGYTSFDLTTSWETYEADIEVTPEDVDRIIFNFGAVAGKYYIDEVEFGEGQTVEADPMLNVLLNDDSNFDGGTKGNWGSWGNSSETSVASPGHDSDYCLQLYNPTDANAWSAQCAYTFSEYLDPAQTYMIQFFAKADVAGQLQFQYQNSSSYGSQGGYNTFDITTDWTQYQYEFTPAYEDVDRILLNFGAVGGNYFVDDVKFGVKNAEAAVPHHRSTGSKIYYVLKSPAEKKTLLLDAMKTWIEGMAAHLAEQGVTPYGYDVINEPITDGSCVLRGVGGNFADDDAAPTETDTDGLSLNWADGHWYWGYYIGEEYGVKAFQYARAALPAETKLFVNDYNLDRSPAKLAALIDFVNAIDAANGAPIVDGIGTQCHLSVDITSDDDIETQVAQMKERVDAMFQTLAQTGKLIRVTELDIALGTATPSSSQLEGQAKTYQMFFESYKANIPEEQRSGITIWTLSDNAKEHEYWLPDESPNLWDKDYKRKWAYKGVCDGLAGQDLGLQFGGDDYKAFYEKNNTADF